VRFRALVVAAVLLVPGLASAQPYAFVSTPAAGSVVAVDLGRDTVLGSIPLDGVPTGCALGRLGPRLFVSLSQTNTVAIVELGRGTIRTVPVGARPAGVAVGPGRRAYVANAGADTVSVVDPGLGQVVATIPVGDGPSAVVAGIRRVYVANWSGGSVSVIDTRSDAVVATLPVGTFPAGLAFHRGTHRLYVANSFDDTVSVIDTATLSVVSTFPVARAPRGLAVDVAGARLYVASFDDGLVQVLDTATGAVVRQAGSGGANPLDLMLSPDGTRLYVAHLQDVQGVVALDTATLAPVASVDVPAGPVAFAGPLLQRPLPFPASGWRRAVQAATGVVRSLAAAPAASERAEPRPSDFDVVISDGNFDTFDWFAQGDNFSDRQPTGGNPDAWRRTENPNSPAGSTSSHFLIRTGSTYDPSQQGAITSMDVSWDRRLFFETQAFEGFLVTQNDLVYRTSERSFVTNVWQPDSRTGLVATDFADGQGHHPDFSATGTELGFGYFRRTQANQAIRHGIDNFKVTIHSAGGAPAGRLAFEKTFDLVGDHDFDFVFTLQRLGGTQGAVSVTLNFETPDGRTGTQTIDWADGDGADKSLSPFYSLNGANIAKTVRLRLSQPTGGATIEPGRAAMVITVYPLTWSADLLGLFLQLQGFFSAFAPAWLLVLAAPALVAARRSWRRKG